MGKFLVGIIGIALFIYALFDLIATPRERVRYVPKPLWFLALLITVIGPLLWLLVGRERSAPDGPGQAKPRPRPPGPRGPDDDPDYLRNL